MSLKGLDDRENTGSSQTTIRTKVLCNVQTKEFQYVDEAEWSVSPFSSQFACSQGPSNHMLKFRKFLKVNLDEKIVTKVFPVLIDTISKYLV
jgi:hypothetical protein